MKRIRLLVCCLALVAAAGFLDGTTYAAECMEGATRLVWCGSCCWDAEGNGTMLNSVQQCVGGYWSETGDWVCSGLCDKSY